MKTVTLSDGSKVTLKDKFSHKASKAFKTIAHRSIVYEPDDATGNMELVWTIPKNDLDAAYEAVLGILILSIEKDGATVPFSEQWLEELDEKDYGLLEDQAVAIKVGQADEEKKGGRSS